MDNQHGKKLPSAVLPTVTGDDYVIVETPDGQLKLIDSNGKRTLVTYDVGDVVFRADDVSPAAKHGGTWQQIAQGRAIIGASDTYPLGSTGGSDTHDHVLSRLGAACIRFDNGYVYGGDYSLNVNGGVMPGNSLGQYYRSNSVGGGLNNEAKAAGASLYGNTNTTKTLQPYLALNIWQKIA